MEKNGMFHLASWLKQNAEASDWKSHSQRNICKHPENIDVASTQYMKDRKMNALPREEIKKTLLVFSTLWLPVSFHLPFLSWPAINLEGENGILSASYVRSVETFNCETNNVLFPYAPVNVSPPKKKRKTWIGFFVFSRLLWTTQANRCA